MCLGALRCALAGPTVVGEEIWLISILLPGFGTVMRARVTAPVVRMTASIKQWQTTGLLVVRRNSLLVLQERIRTVAESSNEHAPQP